MSVWVSVCLIIVTIGEESVRNVKSVRTDVDLITPTMIGTTRTAMVKEVVAAIMVAVANV